MKSFEERLARLEKLSNFLKQGNTPLEEAVTLFEEGMKLAKNLENDLTKIERKVEILVNNPSPVEQESDEGHTNTDRISRHNSPQQEPILELFPELNEKETGSSNENHPGT